MNYKKLISIDTKMGLNEPIKKNDLRTDAHQRKKSVPLSERIPALNLEL